MRYENNIIYREIFLTYTGIIKIAKFIFKINVFNRFIFYRNNY